MMFLKLTTFEKETVYFNLEKITAVCPDTDDTCYVQLDGQHTEIRLSKLSTARLLMALNHNDHAVSNSLGINNGYEKYE